MIAVHWADFTVEWMRHHVPEIGNTPIYLRGSHEVSPRLQSDNLAYTARTLDLQFKPDLEIRDQWAGRGFAVWVNDEFFKMDDNERLGVLIHEMAHLLSDGVPVLTPFECLSQFDQFAACGGISCLIDKVGIESFGIDHAQLIRKQHDSKFTRAAAHIWFRARHCVEAGSVCLSAAGYAFEGSAKEVVNSLYAELVKGGDLFEILKTEPPAEFSALFSK